MTSYSDTGDYIFIDNLKIYNKIFVVWWIIMAICTIVFNWTIIYEILIDIGFSYLIILLFVNFIIYCVSLYAPKNQANIEIY